VGNTLVSAVGLEADFMIKYLCEVNITDNIKVHITTTHVALVIVMLFIMVLAVVARLKLNKANAADTPGAYQNVVEMVIDMLGGMVNSNMGPEAKRFVNYITTLFIFIIISNVSGLLGLRPPTADYGVTLPLGLITFGMIHYCGVKKNKGKHFTALFQPFALLFPINVISEIAVPLSLSLRLFGNVMSGTVLMGLIYGLLPIFVKIGIPSVLHVYFDAFSGCIQAYVFSMLTMVYVNDKIAD
jgi:F-type H+-transporting ATPase subunit a